MSMWLVRHVDGEKVKKVEKEEDYFCQIKNIILCMLIFILL